MVEGERVTLEWTYNTGGSAFQEAELRSQGFAFIVRKTVGASTIIVPPFYGRLTANIKETNASITFLALNRSDSRTYDFVVVNQAFRTALQQFTMDVQCKSTFFKYPFSVCDGSLSLLETVRNPANAYQRCESIFHLAIIDYFSGLKELWGSRIWGLHMEYQCCRPVSPRTHSNQFSVRW